MKTRFFDSLESGALNDTKFVRQIVAFPRILTLDILTSFLMATFITFVQMVK